MSYFPYSALYVPSQRVTSSSQTSKSNPKEKSTDKMGKGHPKFKRTLVSLYRHFVILALPLSSQGPLSPEVTSVYAFADGCCHFPR